MKKKDLHLVIPKKHQSLRLVLSAAVLLALLGVLYLLCGGSIRAMIQRRQLRGLNVILITLDTLRADHLSCYDK
ncbi:MAG: hypothetical protein WCL37_02450, partial [Chrysiogenales bacterium]